MLQRLRKVACPHCGCRKVRKEVTKYKDSHWFPQVEYKQFACGFAVERDPVYLRNNVKRQCRYS